jgi:acyl carrier protein
MTTFERLVKVFNVVFEDDVSSDAIKMDANLRDDMGVSSIGMLYMAVALEEEFEIKFSNDDLNNVTTVSDVVACIEGKL